MQRKSKRRLIFTSEYETSNLLDEKIEQVFSCVLI
jgi:hypothetical protein